MRTAAAASIDAPALNRTDNANVLHAAFSTRINAAGHADLHLARHFLGQIFAFQLHAKMHAILFSPFTKRCAWANLDAAHAVGHHVRRFHTEHVPRCVYVLSFQIRNHNALAAS